jgi:hypothetical protein
VARITAHTQRGTSAGVEFGRMEAAVVAGLVLTVLGVLGWLGGGRKWAFRTVLSALVLAGVVVAGIFLYAYGTDKVAEHRRKKIHECAVAKVANPKCVPAPKDSDFPEGAMMCPVYTLPGTATKEQEETAIASAEEECTAELDPSQKTLHEQISQYRREHGIKELDLFDRVAGEDSSKKVDPKACAARVRKAYPGAYDDLDDATLARKVLAKYPTYCDIVSVPPYFIPEIKDIR